MYSFERCPSRSSVAACTCVLWLSVTVGLALQGLHWLPLSAGSCSHQQRIWQLNEIHQSGPSGF